MNKYSLLFLPVAMLQPAIFSQPFAMATTSTSVLPSPLMLTTALSGGSNQASTVDSPTIRPQSQAAKSEGPASPGNPASILPFLTAQANSVFSITSGKEANFAAGGGNTLPTLASENEKSCGSKEPDVSVGLDLGNGWKVVGLTSLADLALQASSTAQPQRLEESSLCTPETSVQSGVNTACSNAVGVDAPGYGVNSAPKLSASVSGEWKIVGLTSLGAGLTPLGAHGVSEVDSVKTVVSCDNRKALVAPAQSSDLSAGTVSPAGILNQTWGPTSSASDTTSGDLDRGIKTLPSNFQIPLLADLAAGTSDWKIAGITALPVSTGAAAASGAEKASLTPVAAPTPSSLPSIPVTSATDMPEWKVVGVTSLNSPPANPPAVVASALAPIPVVMAPATPLVALPVPQMMIARDDGWKVVGVVPLPQSGEASLGDHSDSLAANKLQPSVADCAEPPSQVQNSTWASSLLHRALDSAAQFPSNTSVTQSPSRSNDAQFSSSTNVAQFPSNTSVAQCPSNTSVAQFSSNTSVAQFPSNISVAQLSSTSATQFPNNTNAGQFTSSRNTLQNFPSRTTQKLKVSSKLTRNTHNRVWPPSLVPQQREDSSHPLSFLKNCSSQFRNAVLKKNTVSTMLELKRAFQKKGDNDDSMVAFWGRKKVCALNKQYHQKVTSSGHKHASKSVAHDDAARENSDTLHTSQFPHRITAECEHSTLPESEKPASPTELLVPAETDDRVVLSSIYRAQTEAQNSDIAPGNDNSCASFPHFGVSSQDADGPHMPGKCVGETRKASLNSCLQVMKTEDRQAIVSTAHFDSDNVNLTTVDPWGVCTDEDLGEIAEMISDKGVNKISHSSSRKRKLSTPRKMVQ